MNKIIATFNQGKLVKTFDDLCDIVFARNGGRAMNQLPDSVSLGGKCAEAGYRVAMFEYMRRHIPMGSVPDAEIAAYGWCIGTIYQAIILAGDVKLLHLMRKDAIEFVNATAYAQSLDEEFFRENFAKPVVLYTESIPLFVDVRCVVVFYDAESRKVCCVFSKRFNEERDQEFGGSISVDELSGRLSKRVIEGLVRQNEANVTLRQIEEESGGIYADLMYESILFALKFVLLLKSDTQPIACARQYKQHKDPDKEREVRGYISHQVVSLTTKYVQAMRAWKPSDRVELDKEGKKLVTIEVRGFIRRQHYGPNNSKTKIVYIDTHDRDVWVREGIRIISVVR